MLRMLAGRGQWGGRKARRAVGFEQGTSKDGDVLPWTKSRHGDSHNKFLHALDILLHNVYVYPNIKRGYICAG
jgi:hypothetical protein